MSSSEKERIVWQNIGELHDSSHPWGEWYYTDERNVIHGPYESEEEATEAMQLHGFEGGIPMEIDKDNPQSLPQSYWKALARFALNNMTNEERLELIKECCPICGKHDPNGEHIECGCWDDE